jgi:hypothetical protein
VRRRSSPKWPKHCPVCGQPGPKVEWYVGGYCGCVCSAECADVVTKKCLEQRTGFAGAKPGRIYFYFVEALKTGYVGKDSSISGSRLRDHERGSHPATEEINRMAADIGEVPRSLRFKVDCSGHNLDWWEREYADRYRDAGWKLTNRQWLSNKVVGTRSGFRELAENVGFSGAEKVNSPQHRE